MRSLSRLFQSTASSFRFFSLDDSLLPLLLVSDHSKRFWKIIWVVCPWKTDKDQHVDTQNRAPLFASRYTPSVQRFGCFCCVKNVSGSNHNIGGKVYDTGIRPSVASDVLLASSSGGVDGRCNGTPPRTRNLSNDEFEWRHLGREPCPFSQTRPAFDSLGYRQKSSPKEAHFS